jgi:hypothetical protein
MCVDESRGEGEPTCIDFRCSVRTDHLGPWTGRLDAIATKHNECVIDAFELSPQKCAATSDNSAGIGHAARLTCVARGCKCNCVYRVGHSAYERIGGAYARAMRSELSDLIEAADLNGLLRAVDGLAAARDWDVLVELANRCEDALERGKQLWPIAAHIDYRLALEGPGEYAAGVLDPDSTRFSLGPLTEVAASSHTWEELVDHIQDPLTAAYVAQERVLRGEVLEHDRRAHPEMLELPLALDAWEPNYCLAVYRSDHVEVQEPWLPRSTMRQVERRPAPELDEPDLVSALLDLTQPWVTESNGAARAVITEGDALGAASQLTLDGLRMGELSAAEGLQRMAWAAASGGAHGRRRGAALGRFLARYVSALLADVGWPPSRSEFGEVLSGLRWFRWDEDLRSPQTAEDSATRPVDRGIGSNSRPGDGGPSSRPGDRGTDSTNRPGKAGTESTFGPGKVGPRPDGDKGWVLRLAIEDPEHGWSAAIAATDLLEEDEAADE